MNRVTLLYTRYVTDELYVASQTNLTLRW